MWVATVGYLLGVMARDCSKSVTLCECSLALCVSPSLV